MSESSPLIKYSHPKQTVLWTPFFVTVKYWDLRAKLYCHHPTLYRKQFPFLFMLLKQQWLPLFLTICPDLFHVSVSQFILSTTLATVVKLQGKRTALWSTLIIQKKFKQFQSCAAYPNINAALASLSQKSFLVQLIELLSPISLIQ